MHIDLSPEQKALREDVRAYYRELFSRGDLRQRLDAEWDELGGPAFREAMGHMGRDGWLTLGWPKEHGGQGRGHVDQFIFWDETWRARAPLPLITVNTVGPMLMQWGTDDQKAELLPRVRDGELLVGIGYTEPGSGTDLASLQTRAVRDGDEWVINGQKVYTTHAQDADYIWLAARTDPDARKHKGISIILVPTDTPGFSCTPIYTIGGERTNATYYEDVRVPAGNLVGGENNGWSLITNQLNHERVALFNYGPMAVVYRDVVAWAEETPHPSGGRVIDIPWVQQNLARFRANLEVLKVMNWKQAWDISQGGLHPAQASTIKVFASEFNVSGYRLLMEVLGEAGTVRDGSPGAVLRGRVERSYRAVLVLTFGGGTNEVQRDIIAMAGLGMPHYKE